MEKHQVNIKLSASAANIPTKALKYKYQIHKHSYSNEIVDELKAQADRQ